MRRARQLILLRPPNFLLAEGPAHETIREEHQNAAGLADAFLACARAERGHGKTRRRAASHGNAGTFAPYANVPVNAPGAASAALASASACASVFASACACVFV